MLGLNIFFEYFIHLLKENIIIEQQPQHNYLNSFQNHHHHHHGHKSSSGISHSHSFNSLSSSTKIKRSVSHRRKLARKLPLIKKELESESNVKQSAERVIQSIYDCDISNLKQSLENGINANTKHNNWYVNLDWNRVVFSCFRCRVLFF